MPRHFESVAAAALMLSANERAELIELLIDRASPASRLHPAWEAEIARRIDEVDAGRVDGIPWEVVMAELKAKLA